MADPTPDAPVEPVAPAPEPQVAPDDEKAAMAEALKKANDEAKRFRLEAKANAERLAKIEQQNMSDTERAIAEAKAAGMTEGLRTAGRRLVDAEVRAAAAGRNVDVKALLEGLDRAAFLDEDGEPKTEAIQKWVDRVAPVAENGPPPVGRVPAGVRGSGSPKGDPANDFASFIGGQLNK